MKKKLFIKGISRPKKTIYQEDYPSRKNYLSREFRKERKSFYQGEKYENK